MEPGNLETLVEKVKAVAHDPQADLLRKFVDLLYQPAGKRERPRRAGHQPGGEDITAIRPRSGAYR
jgi:hypothetical protein